MNHSKLERLNDLIDHGYEFRFGDYISRGFEIFKKNMGGFIGFLLVFILIGGAASAIPVVGTLAHSFLLSPALTVGFFLVAHKIDRGQHTEFGDFFKGFDHIAQLALATLVMGIAYLICCLPFLGLFISAMTGDLTALMDFSFPSWGFLLMIPIIYLAISWSWTLLFIVFYEMKFWDAMEMSRKIISKNWFMIFLFSIVTGLIAASGVILLVIGMLFTAPILYCAQYAAFADVTRLLDEDEDGIEDHLVD